MSAPLFHLAFPLTDLAKARAFYDGRLGRPEGRRLSCSNVMVGGFAGIPYH